MKYSRIFFYLFIFVLIIFFMFLLMLFDIVSITENGMILFNLGLGNFERFITILSTAITAFLYIKLRFFDNRLFNRLQKEYSKQKFFDGLTVIIRMLDIYTPEEIVNRLCSIDEFELDMKKALIELEDLIIKSGDNVCNDDVNIKLSKKEKKHLNLEIKKLLDILDHKLETHYLAKRIDFSKEIKDKTYKRTYRDKHVEESREKGKQHLNDNFK